MYRNAFICHACGFLSKFSGTHCNAPMAPVVVLESVWLENYPTSPPTREAVRKVIREVTEKIDE
ncbi:MAG: hypothetical protein AABW68_04565 [archaeon]